MSEIAERLRNREAGYDVDGAMDEPLLLVAADRIEELERDAISAESVYFKAGFSQGFGPKVKETDGMPDLLGQTLGAVKTS
jgi:hypothetical protein